MNAAAKIWSGLIIAYGVWCIFASIFSEEPNGYLFLGGLIMLITATIAMSYIWKDDEANKSIKKAEEEERIATIVANRINGGR